jgi:hypothetical protein
LERPVGTVEQVQVGGAVVGGVDDGIHEHPRVVLPCERRDLTGEVEVFARVLVERRLREHDEIDRALDLQREIEVAAGQVALVLLLGRQIAVLVVALEHHDAQCSGGRHFRPRHEDRAGADDDRGQPHGGPHHCASVRATDEIGDQSVARNREERHERHTTDTGDVADHTDVVEGISDFAPREPFERNASDEVLEQHPHGGGEPW